MDFSLLTSCPGRAPDMLYLFGAASQPANGCWVGAYVTSTRTLDIDQSIPASQFFEILVQDPVSFPQMGFIFLPKAPADYSGLPAFYSSMLSVLQAGSGTTIGGMVLWLDHLGGFDAGASALRFPNKGGPPYAYTLTASDYPVLAVSEPAPTLTLNAEKSGSTTLGASSDSGKLVLTFSSGAAISLCFGTGASRQSAVALTSLSIPLGTDQAGCLCFDGTSGSAFTQFGFGFTHAVRQAGQPDSALWHPLLDPQEALAGAAVTGTLDPLNGTTATRNRLVVRPSGGTFVSAYRTSWNEKVVLAPDSGSFAGAAGLGGRLYFVPDGAFTLSAPGAAKGEERRLICGLSAIETIGFHDGDALTFSPWPQATVTATMTGTAAEPRWAFSPLADLGVGSARAYVSAVSASALSVYRSESERAPFFAPDSGSSASLLRHDSFALYALPAPQGQSAAFPLLPYEAVTAGQGFAASADGVAAFEYGCIAPVRSGLIEGYGKPPPDAPAMSVAVTPQGYVASFDGKGGLTGLSLGANAGCQLEFSDPHGVPLPPDLRDIFLAPQQFIVISCDPPAKGYAAKYLHAAVDMDGWQFKLTIPSALQIAPGDYKTVIIIKAANTSIADLAGSPSAWTGRSLFNDTVSDPDGLVLSSWLCGYIAQAQAQYAGGAGLASLENFCHLVTDADWDGFLILRVPFLDTDNFDPSLGFLLAGVDRNALFAHHLGSEANQTKPKPGSSPPKFCQNSAFFGLVHYVRPGTQPGAISSSPSYVPSSVGYDFQLLTLDAIFANDSLQQFSSAALVVMNTLFGDGVTASPRRAAPTLPPTNAILIEGAMQHHDGQPTYHFATAPGSACTLYLAGNAIDRVQIDRAQVALDTSPGTTTSAVTFQMAGWLGMLEETGFDLLSYAGISFSNLALTMSYDTKTGADKTFAFDASGMTLAALDEIAAMGEVTPLAVAANTLFRPDSLAATFPLKVDQMVVGAPGKTPGDLGYRPLTTNPASTGETISGPWYGLRMQLPLGGAGALDSANLLGATLLMAWTPNGGGAASYCPFIKITGPGGADLSFQLEGILKFGAAGLLLTRTSDGVFVLEFRSIGVTVFTMSFPPAGSTNLLVAGLPGRSLGWFGAYVDPKAPAITPPPTTAAIA